MNTWHFANLKINSPGAGFINLKGTSVCNSPPRVPQLSLTRIEYEITIPIDSAVVFPSLPNVDEAKLTSSSFKAPSSAMPNWIKTHNLSLIWFHTNGQSSDLPRRSLLELARGTSKKDFEKLAPGVIGQPSLVSKLATCLLNWALTIVTSQCWTTKLPKKNETRHITSHVITFTFSPFNALHSLPGVVGDDNVCRDFFAVIINLTV